MKRHRSPPNNSNGIFSVSFSYRSPIVLLSFSYRSPIVLLSFSYWEAENNTETIRNRTNDERMRNEWGTVEQGWLILLLSNFLQQWQDSNKLLWVSTCHLSHYRQHLSNSNKFDCIRFARYPNGIYFRINPISSSVQAPFGLRSSSVRAPFKLRSSSVRAPFGNRRLIEELSKNYRRTNGESSEARRRCIETLMGSQGKGDPNKNFIFNHLNSNYYGKTYSWLHHFSAPSHSAY